MNATARGLMKTLVLSDIHGNLAALRRVLDTQSRDRVLCLGDLVDYGPHPKECVEFVRDQEWVTVRGNHDQAVAALTSCRCSEAFRPLSEATREMNCRLLGPEHTAFLGSRPLQVDVAVDGLRCRLVHATPTDPMYRYLRPTEVAAWEAELAAVDADVLLTGHTHLPVILHVGRKIVLNPGSIGQPRDGDPRAAFAVIEDGEARLERIAYDLASTVTALAGTGLEQSVFQKLATVLQTGAKAQ